MIGVVSVLVVLAISLIITRIASVALVHTGLGREAARFQARSAFTGVGFTTGESEDIVGHPVRRRIVGWLMLVGNVGIITAMSSLMLSFIQIEGIEEGASGALPLGVLGAGIAALWILASSRWVDRRLCSLISRALNRWTSIDARDYAALLHVREEYAVCELRIDGDNWAADRPLGELGLSGEGVIVLGIECPGNNFVGAPGPDVEIRTGDRVLLYGRTARIAELDRRRPGPAGEQSHRAALEEKNQLEATERARAGRAADPAARPD